MSKLKVKSGVKGKGKGGGQKGGNMDSCPEGVICMDKMIPWIIIIFLLVVGGMFIYFKFYDTQGMNLMDVNRTNVGVVSGKPSPVENVDQPKLNKQQGEQFSDVIIAPPPPSPRQYIVNKEQERLVNPLLPPERSYVLANAGMPVFVDMPTRGYSGGFQQIGLLIKNDSDDGDNKNNNIMPLFGRPTLSNRDRWCYYTTSDKYHSLKIPLSIDGRQCNDDQGCKELYDNDGVSVPGYNGNFKATIYGYDSPKYLPQVW